MTGDERKAILSADGDVGIGVGCGGGVGGSGGAQVATIAKVFGTPSHGNAGNALRSLLSAFSHAHAGCASASQPHETEQFARPVQSNVTAANTFVGHAAAAIGLVKQLLFAVKVPNVAKVMVWTTSPCAHAIDVGVPSGTMLHVFIG